MACCLPTCAQGSSVSVMGFVGNGCFWASWFLLGALCVWEVLAWLVYSSVCTGLGLQRCASRWTRSLSEGRWRHYLCNLWRVCWAAHKTASQFYGNGSNSTGWKPCMPALAGQPSLHGYDACMVYWVKGALRRNCRQHIRETSFSPFRVFLFSRNSSFRW